LGDDEVFVVRLWWEHGPEARSDRLRAKIFHINSETTRHAAGPRNLCDVLRQWIAEVLGLDDRCS
jgi:hypothetical protein